MVSKAMPVLQAVDHSSREQRWKGVRKRSWGRYVCEIRLPHSRQRIWLGSYATAEEAACAYDAASLCLRGTTASLNFPSMSSIFLRDSASRQLPLSREGIQSIAAAAAAQCRNLQTDANVAEKSPSTQSSRVPTCAAEHSIEARQGSPISSGPYTPNQNEETPPWTSRTHLPKRPLHQEEDEKPQASSKPAERSSISAEQSSRLEVSSASGQEDDQCLFSVLKELVALPMIFNDYGTPMC